MAKEISLDDVRHMAKLSRLAIDDAEEKLFAHQFGQILEHMEILSKVDTSGIEPLYSPVQHVGARRPDKMANKRSQAQILANAPETDGEYFIVPRIV